MCFVVFVNCLLKLSALSRLEVMVLLPNSIVLFCIFGGFLLDSPATVFQRMCESCLWFQSFSRCSFQRSVCGSVYGCRYLRSFVQGQGE